MMLGGLGDTVEVSQLCGVGQCVWNFCLKLAGAVGSTRLFNAIERTRSECGSLEYVVWWLLCSRDLGPPSCRKSHLPLAFFLTWLHSGKRPFFAPYAYTRNRPSSICWNWNAMPSRRWYSIGTSR